MSRAERMRQLLETAFHPHHLQITDDSERHRGHKGWRDGGETHYSLEIGSPAFAGLSRVASQQAIYRVLKPEFENGLHALSIRVIV